MEFRTERHELRLDRPFTISRGTTRTKEVLVVRVTEGDHMGVGATSPASYLGDSLELVEQELPGLLETAESEGVDPERAESLTSDLESPAAHAAVSTALHDLAAKRQGEPLYKYLGLPEPSPTPTSITVATESVDVAREQAREAVEDGFEVLKVKAGFRDDIECVRGVREAAPSVGLRVDANAGWSAEEAVGMIEALAALDVEFVEQPADTLEYVYRNTDMPIAADESCVTVDDVPDIADHADVVVVKLMKCGGIQEALRTIEAARSHGLEVMIGCMIESNASLSAAAHLVGWADYADLDGSLLLEDDPYRGVPVRDGRVRPGVVGKGTGARRR